MQIVCESIIGFKDGEPKINITWRESSHPMTLTVDEGRDLALNILENCEAAIHDTFMWDWVIKLSHGKTHEEKQREAATLIQMFREWRGDKRL